MKGFQVDTGNATLYLSIKYHSICETSKQPRDGFQAIKVKLSRSEEEITKYVRKYRSIKGYVDKIEYKDTGKEFEFQYQSWLLHMVNEDEEQAVLEISTKSGAGGRFAKLAENIDWRQMVEFRAWYDTVKEKTAFRVLQNGQTVLQKYTADNPGDCPPPVPRGRQGKLDFTDQEDFLFDRMTNTVMLAVEAAHAARAMRQPSDDSERETPDDNPNSHSIGGDGWEDDEAPF